MPKKRRKKKYRLKKKFRRLLLLIFIIIICIAGCSRITKSTDTKEPIKVVEKKVKANYIGSIKNSNSFYGHVDSNIEKLIVNYMNKYYKAISNLENTDVSDLFSSQYKEEAYLTTSAINSLVETRKLELNDMKITSGKYDIVYTNIEYNGDITKVYFEENDTFKFKYMKNITSKAFNIENEVEVIKEGGEYKFKSIRKTQDYYVMFSNQVVDNEYTNQDIDTIKNNIMIEYKGYIQDKKQKRNEYLSNQVISFKKCDNPYNREKAIEYSNKYILDRNSEWSIYDGVGGNCQNYASQVLYSGGIPMDISGSADLQWKHFDSAPNTKEENTGRSNSWTAVPFFYYYAKNNTGYGLCADTDINYYYAEKGDIGQVGYNEQYRHTVVISGVVKDNNGKVIELLINSNSINLENYPLSGYEYPLKRVIKILGWNN